MTILKEQYVPILKWRMGEYQALLRLSELNKNAIYPLIMIPPIEYDFEEKRMKKTVQEHISPFSERFYNKWGDRPALIDIHESLEEETMDDGTNVFPYIFNELKKNSCNCVPVVKLNQSDIFFDDVKQIINQDERGVCFRLKLEDLMNPNLNMNISSLMQRLLVNYDQIDLILDLEEPEEFQPYADFTNALVSKISTIDHLDSFRSFVLSSMSLKLSSIKKPGEVVVRHEWQLYKHVVSTSLVGSLRVPSYGDYTIETPQFIVDLDMRMINPAGKIIYTSDDVWFITKGGGFRGNTGQMVGHCQRIINSGHYCNPSFSFGDQRISETFNGVKNTGNLTTWKQVGVNHHLTKVVDQLSSFHVP